MEHEARKTMVRIEFELLPVNERQKEKEREIDNFRSRSRFSTQLSGQ
jgi:hypothetical protein